MQSDARASRTSAVHPEIARFRREFDTDWSRLGLATGAFAALAALGVGMVWIPVFNYVWALATLAILIALPYIGARAAIFRLREGRKKVFELDFSGGAPRWSSNDDRFWKHVKDFFKV